MLKFAASLAIASIFAGPSLAADFRPGSQAPEERVRYVGTGEVIRVDALADGLLLGIEAEDSDGSRGWSIRAWRSAELDLDETLLWGRAEIWENDGVVVLRYLGADREVVFSARGAAGPSLSARLSKPTNVNQVDVGGVALSQTQSGLFDLLQQDLAKVLNNDPGTGGTPNGCGMTSCSVTCGPPNGPNTSSCQISRQQNHQAGVSCSCPDGLATCKLLGDAECP